MAHPKRKVSTTRRDKRRTHKKIETKPLYVDSVSGEATVYHRVNLESGYYRGRQVMEGREE
ncbi:MAG: 50S ribosomal protein L32 [Bacteroidia bacterium]|nr:50S ribosomal protein L32 [Bacteroidia bacterium]